MKNCAFTIVAKNYVGLAQILEKSIRKYYNDLSFYIVVADEVDNTLRAELPQNVLIAKEILEFTSEQWDDMSFKYNLTEFCTSIKPASFRYLLANYEYDKCIYLDPDIYFFSSLGQIYDMLNDCQILLTPHIAQISPNVLSDAPESDWLSCGIFNLGFCGVKRGKASAKMLEWWHNRLIDNCFVDNYGALFTDQKWMDFLPSFFTNSELKITRDLGLNVAPWNFFEREVFESNGELRVKLRNCMGQDYPLIFAHYSGYSYTELKKGTVVQNNIKSLANYKDIEVLTSIYAKAIHAQSDIFDRFITQSYTYNFFESGDVVQIVHRRLYRSLKAKGGNIENPLSAKKGTFYELLKNKKMILKGGVNLDKVTKLNIDGVGRKLVLFNKLARFTYSILGFEKYMLCIRLMRPFSRYESQIHLLDKDFDCKNIF